MDGRRAQVLRKNVPDHMETSCTKLRPRTGRSRDVDMVISCVCDFVCVSVSPRQESCAIALSSDEMRSHENDEMQ